MSDSRVEIVIDDRLRLVTAVLAAGDWPGREQAQLTHAVHPHAKQTRQFVADFAHHPAVVWTNQVIESGESLDDVFTAVSQSVQQEAFDEFLSETGLETFWQEHAADWQAAQNDLTAIFQTSHLPAFLNQIADEPISQTIRIMPNLVYPSLTAVLVSGFDALTLLQPPPKAVGESPPWPYGEDPGWVQASVCRRLAHFALADTLETLSPHEQALLLYAATTLYLETAVDPEEAIAYLVRTKKQYNLPKLPVVVAALRDYLVDKNGRSITAVLREQ